MNVSSAASFTYHNVPVNCVQALRGASSQPLAVRVEEKRAVALAVEPKSTTSSGSSSTARPLIRVRNFGESLPNEAPTMGITRLNLGAFSDHLRAFLAVKFAARAAHPTHAACVNPMAQ